MIVMAMVVRVIHQAVISVEMWLVVVMMVRLVMVMIFSCGGGGGSGNGIVLVMVDVVVVIRMVLVVKMAVVAAVILVFVVVLVAVVVVILLTIVVMALMLVVMVLVIDNSNGGSGVCDCYVSNGEHFSGNNVTGNIGISCGVVMVAAAAAVEALWVCQLWRRRQAGAWTPMTGPVPGSNDTHSKKINEANKLN